MQSPDSAMPLVATGVAVVVRSAAATATTLDSIRRVVRQMDGQQIVFGAETMDGVISRSLGARRFSMLLLAAFAGLALVLSSVGIYGVTSYAVAQRTNEIGIRMALGAGGREVLAMVLGHGMKMAGAGVGLGLAAAVLLGRFIAHLLYDVSATDPLTLAAVSIGLMVVALLACYLPARRAIRIDPILALRHD
jgi:ABC-type antimicrobial peptide transport system permease subunit